MQRLVRRPPRDQGSPRTGGAPHTAGSRGSRQRRPEELGAASSNRPHTGRTGPGRHAEWRPPAGRRGLDVLTRDWSPDGGSEGAGGERGNDPPSTYTPPGPTPSHLFPSGPTAVLPLPRSRRYLWGSRLVAASRAGVPLPLPLPLGRWLRLGAGPCQGAGPSRRGRGRPGSSPRREAPRAGTGGQALGRLARSTKPPNGARPSPAALLGPQPQLRHAKKCTCLPDQLGGLQQDS